MSIIEISLCFPVHNQVIVKFSNESETLAFQSPVIKKDLEDLRWYIEVYAAQYTGEPDDEEAKRIEAKLITLGEDLFKAVFTTAKAQQLFSQFQQQHTDKLLTIHSNDADILALPWELLRNPQHGFLSQQQPPVSIRRYCVQSHAPRFTVQAKPKLRLLFIVSRPEDEGFLDPRLDPQAVMDALAESNISQIEVEFLRPATLTNLTQRLNNKDLPAIDIIHFDGHGYYNEKKQQGYLLFESSPNPDNPSAIDDPTAGQRHEVSAALLSKKLVPHQIALVVLSACQSATIGNEPFGSVAAGLTDQGVPTVLAMVYSVLVQSTRQLFAAFYSELAKGQGIGAVLDHARQAMAQYNQRGKKRRGEGEIELTLQDWFVPALYQASNDSALLKSPPAPLFQRGEPDESSPLCKRGVRGDLSNLPKLQAAGFFGRSRELWQIERWFVQGVERITITGFGGQGKTYCAIEAAHWLLRTDLFDSVCFVDFSRYQGLDALRYSMNELGVLLDTTLQDQNTVPPILQTRRLLWVWDNLESLAAETLDELLTVAVQWSAHSWFLFTTRQHRFTQADYAESNPKHQYLDLDGLAETDALAYFNQLWQTAPPPEQPYPTRYQLITLFNKVAFHPLSIGLLAQQLKTRTIAELGERLEALLLCEPKGSEDKSLLASLKLSLERLPPEQRELVKRLGVFQGGAMEDMLLKITEINAIDWAMLRSTLESTGLIQIEHLTHLGVKFPYFKFHPTIAMVLWQELNNAQQSDLVARYRQSYYQLARFLYDEDNKNPYIARAIASRELPNLLHAIYAVLQANEAFMVEFANCVNNFLEDFCLQHERESLTSAMQQSGSEVGSQDWFLAQSNQAEQLLDKGDYVQAKEIFQRIRLQLDNKPSYNLCLTLGRLGSCFNKLVKREEAVECYQQGLSILQQLESSTQVQQLISIFYNHLADTFRYSGNYSQAKKHYEQSLAITMEMGNIRGSAVTEGQLGTLAMLEGNLTEAEQRYRDALKMFQELKEPRMEAVSWHELGFLYEELEEWILAEEAYRKSAQIEETQDNLLGAVITWNNLAGVIQMQGKYDVAESWYRKAIAVLTCDNPRELSGTLNNLASLLLENYANRLAEAEQLIEAALAIRKTLDESSAEIWMSYSLLSEIAKKQGKELQAKACLQLARESYLRFSGMPNEMTEWTWLINAIIDAVFNRKFSKDLETELINMKKRGGQNLAAAIQQILNGERNEITLLEPLDFNQAAIIHLILKGIANPESLESLFNS